MLKKIVKNKKIIVSLCITIFLTVTLLFPVFIHLNANVISTYFPNDININQNEFIIHDYEKNKNELTSQSNDAWIYVELSEAANYIYIDFTESLQEPIDIEIYYSNDGEFNGTLVEQKKLELGSKSGKVMLSECYKYLRIDIGNTQDQSFSIDKIEISNVQSRALLYFETVFSGILLLLIVYLLSKIKTFNNKIKLICKRPFFQNNKLYIYGILFFTFMFCILYFKYLYLDYAYIFSDGDICGDTLDGIYASYYETSNKLHNLDFSLYSFQNGFGMNAYNMISVFVQPFELITQLFPINLLEKGILFSVYLRLLVIMFYSLKYFRLFYKDFRVIIVSALLWTFCSYIVIWGQQYGFASNIAYFTMINYYLYLLCSRKAKGTGVLVSLILIAFGGYYFFYSIGIYTAIYICVYELLHKGNIKECFFLCLKMLGYAFITVGVTAFVLLPGIFMFLDSARPSAISDLSHNLFEILDIKTLISMIGRFLSPNLLGTALDGTVYSEIYQGLNYYEMAFLSVSTLSLFAINYHIYSEKRKKYLIFTGILLLLSLITFLVGFVLTFGYNFRWVYMICFVQVLLLSKYLNFILNEFKYKILRMINIRTFIQYVLLSIILIFAEKFGIVQLDFKIFLILWCFILIYIVLTSVRMKRANITVILVLLFEILYADYAPINQRGTEQIDVLHHKYYFDGTADSISAITSKDPEVYRMNKTFISRFYNDARVQGFNGMSVYATVNSANLKNLLNTYDVKESYNHPNYFKVDYDNLFLNGLFGVKYIISDHELDGMEMILKNNHFIYKNPFALPFGFLYDQKIDVSYVENKDKVEYILSGYFDETYEGNHAETVWSKALLNIKQKDNKLYVLEVANTDSNYHTINLNYDIDTTCITNIKVYVNNDLEKDYNYTSKKGLNEIKVYLPYMVENEKDIKVEIQFIGEVSEIDFISNEMYLYDESKIKDIITHYQKQSLLISDFNNDYIKGGIHNTSKKNKMLFIPIVYSDEWSLKIDGQECIKHIINGGFIGAEIPSGKHMIELRFMPKGLKVGFIISVITCLHITVIIIYRRRRKMNEIN